MLRLFAAVIAWGVLALAGIGGCAMLEKFTDDAAVQAGKAIKEYCKLPADTRDKFRAKVAERAAPNTATINCVAGS